MNLKVLFTFFFCCCIHLNGQELYGKYLGIEQSLLSKECYDIGFNKDGYLIVGTQYGPMKYDGEKFIAICLNLPTERRIIYDFETSPKGETYLLNSKNELFILKKDKAEKLAVVKAKSVDANIHFKKLHWYSKGLMLGSNETIYDYQFKSKELIPTSPHNKSPKNSYIFHTSREYPFERTITLSPNILVNEIVFKFPKKTTRILVTKNNAEAREDFIRIGKSTFAIINAHLYRISSNNVEAFPYDHILFMEYFHKRLWLATTNGLLELDKSGKLIHHHFQKQLVGGITPLPGNGIAISFNQRGVFICSDINERCYPGIKPTQLAHNQKDILIGNYYGELYRFQTNKLIKIRDHIEVNTHMLSDPNTLQIRQLKFINKQWYVCTLVGMYSLSEDLQKVEKRMISKCYSFSDFFFSGGKIYAISWSGIRSIAPIEKQLNLPLIRCKYQIDDTTILLGSEEGLFEFHVNSEKLVHSPLLKKNIFISCIQEPLHREFLITSRFKGIYHIKNGKLVAKHQPPCFSVRKAILHKSLLIAAGNQGVYIKSLKEQVSWTRIFESEVQNIFVINNTLFIFADDALITKQLKNHYKPSKPEVLLVAVTLGDKKLKYLPKEISYKIPISLDLDILSFDANAHHFYYRLSGKTSNTEYTEGTKINFEALPSGNYQLELFPVIAGKIQFFNAQKYSFVIRQPFWETTLFYLLISVVILLILLSIRLIRNLQRKKRVAERAELESKINEYKLLAVKAQVNPHFLSNGLAAIQALILKGDNDYAAHYLAKFSFLMRKVLHYSDTQFISVYHELQLADAYLDLELLRSKNRFSILRKIDLSDNELNTIKIPALLLQPILENAIWHGLKTQENNPELVISIHIEPKELLVLKISDNGHGYHLSDKRDGHESKGNQLITERIDTLNQQFRKQVATMEILTSDQGTTVVFKFSSELYQYE